MASALTPTALKLAIQSLFAGPVNVVLTRQGEEIQDRGYTAQVYVASAPVQLRNDASGVVVTNTEEIRFGPWLDPADELDGWELRDSAGTVLARGDLPFRDPMPRGQMVFWQPRAMTLRIGV